MSQMEKYIGLLKKSHSPFHVVEALKALFDERGFIPLPEDEAWILEEGRSYYVIRNHSSVIAFSLPHGASHFQIMAAHTDSPTFKVKPNPLLKNDDTLRLNVEPYGGMIYSTWMDRPLSIAGRVMVKNGNAYQEHLIDLDEDLLQMPNVAIHMNREVNNGYKWNPSIDTIPLLSSRIEDFDFFEYLKKKVGFGGDIMGHDLFLYNRDVPRLTGINQAFLSAPRLDDLACVYSCALGFLSREENQAIDVFVAFDNEEVGSLTRQGAQSTFLSDTLRRIVSGLGLPYEETIARSMLISADNAHANHPNHPELSDPTTHVRLNGGIVLKYHANQNYTTDGFSGALVKAVAGKGDIPLQEFSNRNDIRGGSTLGNLSNGQVSLLSADIGIPQLAMHSANELCGVSDIAAMERFAKEFYSSTILLAKNGFEVR